MKAPKTQILFLTAAVLFAAAVVRLTWIEDQVAAEACRSATDALICRVRHGFVMTFHYKIFGWTGLVAGALALWRPSLWMAGLALILGGLALVFYTGDMGAGAFVLGLMALARTDLRRLVK